MKYGASILMSLCPVQHSIVDQPAALEQIFETASQPAIVRLLLELQGAHILEVLCKLL